jgi:hypothetical protein
MPLNFLIKITAESPEKPALQAPFLAILHYFCHPVKKPGILLCHLTLLNN